MGSGSASVANGPRRTHRRARDKEPDSVLRHAAAPTSESELHTALFPGAPSGILTPCLPGTARKGGRPHAAGTGPQRSQPGLPAGSQRQWAPSLADSGSRRPRGTAPGVPIGLTVWKATQSFPRRKERPWGSGHCQPEKGPGPQWPGLKMTQHLSAGAKGGHPPTLLWGPLPALPG